MIQNRGDLIDTTLAEFELVKVTEGDVQDGTILGSVDMLPREHLVAIGLDICLPDQVEEGVEDGFGNKIFGIIEEE